MRKLILVMFAFILLAGINVGKAQTASLPYAINFGTSQAGWTAVDESQTPGTTWKFYSRGSYIQGVYYDCVVLKQDYSSACNDYYVSPAFTLEAGKSYTVEYNTCAWFNGNDPVMSFEWGTSNTDMSTFKSLRNITLDENWVYPPAQTLQFGVPSDGTYYFAFHATSPVFNSEIHLFEFKLYESDDSGETPEDVVVEVPYSVDLTASHSNWTSADNNNDGQTWSPSVGFGVTQQMPLTGSNDDDYFSPKVSLKGGVTYKITTDVAVTGDPFGYDIVTLTQGTDKAQMTAIKQLALNNPGENWEENYFTPANDGEYYFSFHNTSNSGGNPISLYSFAIEEYVEVAPAETEIYATDFTESNPLQGWTIIDANADDVKWTMEEGYAGPSYDGNMAMGAANDWLITPGLNFEAGDYVIRYTVSQAGAFDEDQLVIKWGTEASVEGMTHNLITETIDLSSGSVDKVLRLSCTEPTTAYIGFNLTTALPNGIISIDKISVSKTSKAKPMSVENLEITSDYAQQKVTLKWTNPSYDVTDAPILSPLNIEIYENGVKVATLEDRALGAADTYTYKPESFGGMATYRVVAVVDDVESLPVEKEVNLDDIQGEPVAVREFNTVNDYNDWVIENKDGGNTWQQILYDNGGLSVKRGNSDTHNDWAISPGVSLDPAQRYIIKFKVSTSSSFASTLKLFLGTEQSSEGMTTELLSLDDIYYNGYVEVSTQQFSVESAGVYYIGFQDCKTTNSMNLNGVGIYYINAQNEEVPVQEIPYTQNFDQSTTTPEGWSFNRSSEQYGFRVAEVRSASSIWGTKAYSGANALFAAGEAPAAREEIVYTPKFLFQPGKTYNVSFMLYMLQQGATNHVSLYKATDHSISAIDAEPLLQTDVNTGFSWAKQSVELTVEEEGEYCFAIKLNTNEANGGEVIIDDFSVEEEVYIAPVKPAAVINVSAMPVSYSQSVIFNWAHPLVDAEGNPIQKGSVIKTQIYDGENLIAEQSVTMPDPSTLDPNTGLAASCSYAYSNSSDFAGQKIYKFVPSIETEVGPATSCVLSISSFTDGYLKEHTYEADFAEGDNDWTTVDNDNDGNTWAHAESAMTTNGNDEWLISPEILLNPDKSYYVLCEFKTDYNQSVNITFTRGNGQDVEDQTEVIRSFNDLILNDYVVMEVGTTFNPEAESNYFGIHVEGTNGTKVQIKDFKVMRLFTQDEPVELPYEEDFENRVDINPMTLFTNKWGCRTSSASLFRVTTMPENTVAAHSGSYAVVADEFDLGERTETLYTPYFSLKAGETYEISYYLYMPGNGDNLTVGGLYEAYTQDESGLELPLLEVMSEPAKEWTLYTVKYTPEYDMDYCFYLEFYAAAANSGIIAIDDFKIEKVSDGSGIDETIGNGNLYYAASTSTLYVPDGVEYVSVFNLQGQQVVNTQPVEGMVSLASLNRGVYVVKAVTADGNIRSLKVMKN